VTVSLVKVSDSYYRSDYGYFFLENNEWLFFAFEKTLKENDLVFILKTLNELKEGLADGRKP
jgi:hypothetical protein